MTATLLCLIQALAPPWTGPAVDLRFSDGVLCIFLLERNHRAVVELLHHHGLCLLPAANHAAACETGNITIILIGGHSAAAQYWSEQ